MENALMIFTDGGCSGNPGPGGWAFVIAREEAGGPRIISSKNGGEKTTTNNRMELTAVLQSLRALRDMEGAPRAAVVVTDSQYVQKGITDWIVKWKRNGWVSSGKTPVKNRDLWEALDAIVGEFSLEWQWVRGHSGVALNEMCDALAQEAIAWARG